VANRNVKVANRNAKRDVKVAEETTEGTTNVNEDMMVQREAPKI